MEQAITALRGGNLGHVRGLEIYEYSSARLLVHSQWQIGGGGSNVLI